MSEPISNTTTTHPDDAVTYAADGTIAGVGGNVDWKRMYEAQAAETDRLKAVNTAARFNSPVVKGDDRQPMTANRLKSLMGPLAWLKSSSEEKITGLGQNPKEIDVDFLRRSFGRNNDGKTAQDLHKSSPFRYRQLREAAIVLDIFGN